MALQIKFSVFSSRSCSATDQNTSDLDKSVSLASSIPRTPIQCLFTLALGDPLPPPGMSIHFFHHC